MMPSALVPAGRTRPRGVDGRRARWWWLGLPIVPVQGYRLVRTLPRFADADGVTGRVGSGDRRMKVVALGDSVAAGYAVGHHRSSVAGEPPPGSPTGTARRSNGGHAPSPAPPQGGRRVWSRPKPSSTPTWCSSPSVSTTSRTSTARPASAVRGRHCSMRSSPPPHGPRSASSASHRSTTSRRSPDPWRMPSAGEAGSSTQ